MFLLPPTDSGSAARNSLAQFEAEQQIDTLPEDCERGTYPQRHIVTVRCFIAISYLHLNRFFGRPFTADYQGGSDPFHECAFDLLFGSACAYLSLYALEAVSHSTRKKLVWKGSM